MRMLNHSRSTRLCQTCRSDLLRLFENGLCTSSPITKHPNREQHRSRANRAERRSFSQTKAAAVTRRSYKARLKPSGAFRREDIEQSQVEGGQTWAGPSKIQSKHSRPTASTMPSQHHLWSLDGWSEHLVYELKEDEQPLEGRGWEIPQEAIRDVEQLGLSESNITDHELARRRAEQHLEESSQLTDRSDIEVELKDDEEPGLIERIRGTIRKDEEVVRLARQKYGEVLPDEILNERERKIYVRLYGQPLERTVESEQEEHDESAVVETLEQNQHDSGEPDLLGLNERAVRDASEGNASEEQRQDRQDLEELTTTALVPSQDELDVPDRANADSPLETGDSRIQAIARSLGGEVYSHDNNIEDAYEEGESHNIRQHPLTALGKFGTYPRTISLPRDAFVGPVEKILSKYSNKHLKEMCERTFGGKGLPHSPLTPYSAKRRQQIPVPLDSTQHLMGEMEGNAYLTAVMPPTYASIMSVLVETRKRLGSTWLRSLILKEGGPHILDAGAGGAGILAWNEFVRAEWANLHGEEAAAASPPPPCKAVVLTGSDTLRHRAAALLENTTFVPRLPDTVHTRDMPTLDDSRPAQSRKQFDVILAPHTLFPMTEEFLRKNHVQNLWTLLSENDGVLILLEKAVPRGFEAVAAAREFLLERYIASPGSEKYESPLSNKLAQEDQVMPKDKGMIIAPCTNHSRCPMYTVPGVGKGRKDFCAFKQKFVRPVFLQRVMDGGRGNDEEVGFSYIAVLKGGDLRGKQIDKWDELRDPMAAQNEQALVANAIRARSFEGFEVQSDPPLDPEQQNAESASSVGQPLNTTLPRLVFSPLKRTGHVSMDVCTTEGKIERWTVPRSFSKQAYRDARKSRWGDLWPLGAKTRVTRNLQLGGAGTKKERKKEMKRMREDDRVAELQEMEEEEMLGDLEMESERRRNRAKARRSAMGDENAEVEALERGLEQEMLEDEQLGLDDDDDDDDDIDDEDMEDIDEALEEIDLEGTLDEEHGAADDTSTKGNADAQARLLNTLKSLPREEDVDAALKEWEEEYETDKRLSKGNRRRDGRRRKR